MTDCVLAESLAVARKIRPAKSVGDPCPLPGSSFFQTTFSDSDHVTGGVWSFEAIPLLVGPRHCIQSSANDVVAKQKINDSEAKSVIGLGIF